MRSTDVAPVTSVRSSAAMNLRTGLQYTRPSNTTSKGAWRPRRQPSGLGSGPGQMVPSCSNGQRLSPYEQKTQQSPGLGDRMTWHPAHSWKATHPLVGIVSTEVCPQAGQVRVTVRSAMYRG